VEVQFVEIARVAETDNNSRYMPKGPDASVAADLFSALFRRFRCSSEHLREAFGRIGASEKLTKLHCLCIPLLTR
jgi:hypothetical protein